MVIKNVMYVLKNDWVFNSEFAWTLNLFQLKNNKKQ